MAGTAWNSLEVVKLVVAAATPVLVLLLGVVVSRAARRLEEAQWANRKLIERRLELYDEMAERLNDLYCFFGLFGNFREVEPPVAVRRKREFDKVFHVNEFLMGPEFAKRYKEFMEACFQTYTGVAEDAKLRSPVAYQCMERQRWDPAWDRCFVGSEEVTPIATVEQRYRSLMACFAGLIGVQQDGRSG